MARKVTIDVEARFIDNVTDEAKAAAKSFDNLEQAAEDAQKDLKNLGKTNAKPKVDADTSRVDKKLSRIDKLLNKLGRSKTETKLSAMDKASAIIEKVTSKAKAFAGKTYSALVKLRDSNVLSSLNKMSNGLKSLTNKAWSVAVKIKDTFTAPLTKLKNMLFNVKTLIAGIASAWVASKLVINPINLADQYSGAKIGFSTLLGETAGQQMMDDLDEFAKKSPFDTSGVISNAQKMLAMGWDAEKIVEDMETIGNAAAATGNLNQGLESIVRAMSQIKTKGKLSAEELNQLAEAGIAAKPMLAEALGYGTGDEALAKFSADQEKGLIGADKALDALLVAMQKYDGMMDSMANEKASGLLSQLKDTFEVNILRKWGQGLQDGARRGLGSVVKMVDEAEGALEGFGDMVYDIGERASNWFASKFENAIDRILKITDSFEFENATLGGKIGLLWKGLVSDPLKEWWETEGRDSFIEAGGKFGTWLGESITKGVEFLSNGLLSLLGVDTSGVGSDAGKIGRAFWDNFTDAFDWDSIKSNLAAAISGAWDALPTWAKIALGVYGVGKAAGVVGNVAGGITKLIGTSATAGVGNAIVAGSGLRGLIGGNVVNAAGDVIGATGLVGAIGSTGNAMVAGTGILGKLASAGYALTGGPASAGAYFGAGMSGAAAAGIGAAGIAGGLVGGASLIKGGIDLYKGYTTDDEVEAKASKTSGWTAIGGVGAGAAAGAAIGSIIPGLGTAVGALVGAGIGGLAGWIGGNKWADNIRATDDAINDVSAATADLETEQEKLEVKAKMVWQNIKDHFGDIKLSMSEVQALTKQIVWGDDTAYFDQFTTAAKTAEASLTTLKSTAENTNRWMWKASLGITFNDDDKEAIVASFDEYITSAINYAENKHHEFSAAVSLLVDPESEAGKNILSSGNAFYAGIQEQLNGLGGELSSKVKIALADGVITLNEHDEIINLQKQIAEITEKLSNAETEAELELVKVKFGSGNLDEDSFDSFMEQMGTTLSERVAANDDAFKATVSSLKIQLSERAIRQEEYDKQLQTLVDGYTGKVDDIKARIMNVELEIIGEAYAKDGVTAEKLQNALEKSLKEGIDPINWTTEDARRFLGISNLSESSAGALGKYLSEVASQLELVEVDGELLLKLGVKTEGVEPANVEEAVASRIPESMDEEISVQLTAAPQYMNNVAVLMEDFGIPEYKAETILWKLSGAKGIEKKLEILCTDFGINKTEAETVLWKLSGQKQILKPLSLTALDFGIRSSYSSYPTVNVTPQLGTVSSITLPTSRLTSVTRKEFRGGIVGGDSAMDAFARGGLTDPVDGIVGGSTRFIRVNEESPEMIIPLSEQRRDRALKLWNKTGEMLGVPGFARGGSTDGDQDEGIRFSTYRGGESAGGRAIQINMGGIKLEINVSGGSDKESIVEAIKAQAGELADYIVGQIADALETEFENTPVRGGIA